MLTLAGLGSDSSSDRGSGHRAARAGAEIDTRVNAPLRLVVHGLSAEDCGVLAAILQVLADRTERHWTLGDGPADLALCTRAAVEAPAQAELHGLILREGENADADALVLSLPLRVMGVLDLLNAADDRLRQRRLESAGAHADHDGRMLAAALARLVERRHEQTVRVRILGHGTLYLCMRTHRFWSDLPPDRLATTLREHRFVLTTLAPSSPEFVERLATARPLDEALWAIGLIAVSEHVEAPGVRFRLRRWPDFTRLPHRAEHLQACALLAARALDIDELAAGTDLGRADAAHLVHACLLCDLVEIQRDSVVSEPPLARPAGFGGLFNRLRRHLGL